MNDQNKPKQSQETPKNGLGASAVKTSAWKKLLSKKWAAPAAFMAAAAIIVTLMWIYRAPEDTATTTTPVAETTQGTETGTEVEQTPVETDEAVVASESETLAWPTAEKVTVATNFYDEKATAEERQSAILQVNDTFTTSQGINLTAEGDKSFDVSAALSGKVSIVMQHPTNGNIIEIKHADGLTTVYQSLTGVLVQVGDSVEQGQIIAKAGRNEIGKDLGNHLYFEVRQNGNAVNPTALLNQQAE
ncbi:stage II sporulation protein Q [Paenibacillus phyllosphaerae]|uniref:Stage II sporulation protein Q n=1 Tax=Paenibacillus phyllosphaerae TaxID=274593 RepID=A0A7W5FMQ9_9BACL|nr:M23 family metallopeptidase [Paenibacillus phyllosphaerae]MBB3110531.1 stage II sporulation protein Q [Paenibacillus phyllosphaerae]